MNQIEMTAEVRKGTGKSVTRKLRADGKIPAVVYGRGVEPTSIVLNVKDLTDFLAKGRSHNTLVTLKVEGRSDLSENLMIFREIQRHHIKRTPISADLMIIDRNRPITVQIPVILKGVPEGEKLGGVLQHIARELEIVAVPDKVPDSLEFDVTRLLPGDTMYIEEVTLPEGVSVNVRERTPICNLTIPRGYEDGVPAAEGAEGSEGEGEKKSDSGKE